MYLTIKTKRKIVRSDCYKWSRGVKKFI